MADRYWVGGSGSWSVSTTNWSASSGGAGGASLPTSADDVIFDANSNIGTGAFTVTIPTGTTVNCRNFSTGGAGGALDGTMTLAFASSTATLNIYGSIATPAANFVKTGTGNLNFFATTTGQTVSLQGTVPAFSAIVFNGVGGGWTLQTAISSGDWVLTAGSLDTNGQTLTQNSSSGDFTISGTGVRSLSLGASTIIIQSITGGWDATTTTNLTFSAGTSTIQISPSSWSSPNFDGGGLTYNNLTITYPNNAANTTSLTISGNNTFNNVTTTVNTSTNGLYGLSLLGNQTIGGTWTTANTTIIRRLSVASSVFATARTVSVAAVSGLNNVDFADITITGAATPLSGTALGDAGGNTGITFDAPKTVYWNLAGTQFWNATGWALLSGGSPALANFPLAQDTAVINNSSAGTNITLTLWYFIGTLDTSARTTSFNITSASSSQLFVLGNWTNGSGLTYAGSGTTLTFQGRSSQTLTTAGLAMTVSVNAAGTSLSLSGTLSLSGSMVLTRGSFVSNNNAMSMTGFSSSTSNVRTLDLGTSVVDLTGTGTPWSCASSSNLTLIAANSTIRLTNNTTTARQISFGNTALTYGTIVIGGSTSTSTTTFNSASTVGGITISNITSTKTVAHTIDLNLSGTMTWQAFGVTGSPGAVVSLQSITPGNQEAVIWGGGVVAMDYMSIRDFGFSYTLGPANPYLVYAGANSTNLGNNAGIAFINGNTQRAYRLTSGTSWTVPADWTPGNTNTIHLIGGGGGGSTSAASGVNRAGGAGGGGGGYTVVTNFSTTAGATINYAIGSAGAANADGGDTTWNSGAFTAGGGKRGTATTAPSSTGGAGGTGTFAGGSGGNGGSSTFGNRGRGGGGGGGAGGPNGVGGSGGSSTSSTVTSEVAGGGGGGNGGGSNGSFSFIGLGGNGGNNFAGAGSGAGSPTGNGTAGTLGGGGGGAANTGVGGSGGSGIDIANTLGGGGGRGGSAVNASSTNNGLYGGGGGGGGVSTTGITSVGGAGSQGVIFIVYSVPPSLPVILSGVTITGGVTIT